MPIPATLHSPPSARSAAPHGVRRARTALAALTFVVLPLAAGCYPDQISDTEDLSTVTTLFDSSATFTATHNYHTYALVDSVRPIGADSTEHVPAAFSNAIISQIRTEMNAKGWTEITGPAIRTNTPDVFIAAGAVVSQYIYADWYAYWGYWPYWPGYYPGYPWYTPVVYSYEVGTLVVTMVDGHAVPVAGQRIPIRWIGVVRGVAGNQAFNQAAGVAGVEQAFLQSPYLQVGASAVTR